MAPQEAESSPAPYPVRGIAIDDWTALVGTQVEIWNGSNVIDRGTVDAVTIDGKILWLRHEGAATRRLVEVSVYTVISTS